MSIARGFQASYDVVSRALKSRDEAKLKERVGQEGARYGVTEGAYGADLGQNIEQVQGLQQQAIQRAQYYGASEDELAGIEQQYAPSIAELQRRQGLTAPDYSVGSRAQNFATRQEARQAAAPMRTEGLSSVYRQAGEIEKADELEARAFEQQRAIAAEERAKAGELRAQQTFAGGETERGLRINEAVSAAAERDKETNLNLFISENPNADFSAITAQAKILGMSSAQQFKIASDLTGIKEQTFKDSQMRIRDLVKNQGLDGLLKAHKDSKDLDPNSHFEVIRGKGGKLSLNRVNTETGDVIQPNVFSGSEAEITGYLNKAAVDPATIIDYTMNLEKDRLAMDKDRAVIRASDLSSIRAPDINEYVDARGNVTLIDVGRLPRDKNGQPVLPEGLRKLPTGSATAKDLTPQQQRAFDVLKDTAAFKTAAQRGDQTKIRELLVSGGVPPEAYFGAQAGPPGGGDWAASPDATPAAAPAATAPAAAATPRAAPTQGLTRDQVGQAVTQQQGSVQAETRVRRAAITAFEQDPRVRQAYDAVRQLRRDGQAARANNLESQINAQRQRFIDERVGGGR